MSSCAASSYFSPPACDLPRRLAACGLRMPRRVRPGNRGGLCVLPMRPWRHQLARLEHRGRLRRREGPWWEGVVADGDLQLLRTALAAVVPASRRAIAGTVAGLVVGCSIDFGMIHTGGSEAHFHSLVAGCNVVAHKGLVGHIQGFVGKTDQAEGPGAGMLVARTVMAEPKQLDGGKIQVGEAAAGTENRARNRVNHLPLAGLVSLFGKETAL